MTIVNSGLAVSGLSWAWLTVAKSFGLADSTVLIVSAICLRQIDLLSRPKDSALPGLDIGRHSPQPQSHIERIDAECGPEGKLADPMLVCMAGGAQRNGVAIARLHPDTAIGCCTHMRGL